MKKHDNTLYVTTQGAYLAREGANVLVRVEKQTRLRLPIHNLGGIVCFGNVGCSPFAMGLCGQQGVAISFLTENGRFLARVLGAQTGNVILRRASTALTSDPGPRCRSGPDGHYRQDRQCPLRAPAGPPRSS